MDSNHSPAPASPPSSTPRRIRRDGWTIDRQVKFIMALNATGSVTRAAAAAGMSRESAYRLRDGPGHEDFARVWDAAAARKGHTPQAEVTPAAAGSPARPLAKVTKVTVPNDSRDIVHLVHFRELLGPAKFRPKR